MSETTIAYALVPSPEHNLDSHPENVGRFQHLGRVLEEPALAPHLHQITPRPATEEELTRIHPRAYLEALQRAVAQGPGYIDYAPTYVTPGSYQAALNAAGATLQVAEAVARGGAQSGFALVRPPGHHATPTEAMGFCLLNNLAVAVRKVQALGFRKVMIVDFDVHHGNGTQDAFESEPDVLYLSTHQSGIYPGSGHLDDTGQGIGKGTVVNIPLPAGVGDLAFAAIAEQVIVPLAERFAPEFVLVSAGFDSHWRDTLAGMQLTCRGYYDLSLSLVDIARRHCGGRLVFVLEGGYDPEALAGSV
ncbi:MAG: histone deacetylase, partial [Anaerolineales bacterium]|nr:histone deacetylase [Anaerolineales bacterium]